MTALRHAYATGFGNVANLRTDVFLDAIRPREDFQKLVKELESKALPKEKRILVTSHDAFGYFLRAYGLTFVGAVIPSTSSEAQPSAKDLAALQDLIRREGVKAIFAEEEIDPKVAREISKDTGVRIVDNLYADSLGKPGSGAETVDGMIVSNARKIAEALR